jgi:prepilin signal peptidase PulO-like enzyme (type II secretory pathway)
MNELLSKLSSYNVFNYLLPGIVFAVLAGKVIRYPVVQRDVFTGAFLYYFLGMVVSRFGSLVLEPVLKRLAFVRFADYGDFVAASKEDSKLEVLSETNNTYRTLASLFTLLLLLKGFVKLEAYVPWLTRWRGTVLVALLVVMFLFSYRKQTSYIASRVRHWANHEHS